MRTVEGVSLLKAGIADGFPGASDTVRLFRSPGYYTHEVSSPRSGRRNAYIQTTFMEENTETGDSSPRYLDVKASSLITPPPVKPDPIGTKSCPIREVVPPILTMSPRIRNGAYITPNGKITVADTSRRNLSDLNLSPGTPRNVKYINQIFEKLPQRSVTPQSHILTEPIPFTDDETDRRLPPPCDTPARLYQDLYKREARGKALEEEMRLLKKIEDITNEERRTVNNLLLSHAAEVREFDQLHGAEDSPKYSASDFTKKNQVGDILKVKLQSGAKAVKTENKDVAKMRKRIIERQKQELLALNAEYRMKVAAIRPIGETCIKNAI